MQKENVLIKGMGNLKAKDKILVCFPFAGGGASAFYSWKNKMPEDVKVCAIQLPGREERIMEELYTDMRKLLDDVIERLNCVDNELILFGHSMGAKMAYETAKILEKNHKKVRLLIVSGSRAPHIKEPNPICQLTDDDFKRELARFEGTPREILECEELLNLFLPMLRADFTLDETYLTKKKDKIQCPILALGGCNDCEVDKNDLEQWQDYTMSDFECKIFQGGHFFIRFNESEVLTYMWEKMMEHTNAKNNNI